MHKRPHKLFWERVAWVRVLFWELHYFLFMIHRNTYDAKPNCVQVLMDIKWRHWSYKDLVDEIVRDLKVTQILVDAGILKFFRFLLMREILSSSGFH